MSYRKEKGLLTTDKGKMENKIILKVGWTFETF